MLQRFSLLFFILLAPMSPILSETARAQSKQKQEQRDNKKVKEAEQDLSAAKKKLTDSQRVLRDAIKGLASQQNRLVESKQALRKAESDAEKKLGEKLGLPALFQKAETIREQLQSRSKPVLDALKQSPDWKQAKTDAETARLNRDLAQEDPELSDEDRERLIKELSKKILKPNDLESAAITADKSCAKLQSELNQALETLNSTRKQIDQEKIAKAPEVAKMRKEVGEIQKIVNDAESSVVSARKRVSAAAKEVAESQTKLNRARLQDKRNDKK